jgi:hypothetical protein
MSLRRVVWAALVLPDSQVVRPWLVELAQLPELQELQTELVVRYHRLRS